MFLLRNANLGNRITDTFDRANGNLTTPWTVQGTALTIVGNESGLTTTTFNQNLFGLGLHSDSLFTDDQCVEFTRGTLSVGAGGSSLLIAEMYSNAAQTNGVAMALVCSSATAATLQIYVPTAWNTFGTAKFTSSGITHALNDVFVMAKTGTGSGTTFTVYQNGVSRGSWNDSTQLVNVSNRRVAFGAQGVTSFSGGTSNARAAQFQAYDSAA